jgi:signal transduction histidine kinase/ActR/RegA family two-component response regulator
MTRDDLLASSGAEGEQSRRIDMLFALLDEAPAFLAVIEGPELRVAMINRRTREALQGTALLGKSIRDAFGKDHPVVLAIERVCATGNGETIRGFPASSPYGQRSTRYFTRDIVPLRDEHGKGTHVLVWAYEVTDEVLARQTYEANERRNQAELQRVFALLEEAPMLINVLEGPELRLVVMNRRSREFFAGRDFIGMSFCEMVPPDNAMLTAARRVYETGIPESLEVIARDLEGFVGRSFASTVVPIPDLNGKITRIMVASLEVTEQRRAQDALEAQARDLESARRQAVEASRAKDEFLAMLGHELRNPLAPMLTTLELMRLRGTQSNDVDVLHRQVRHLTRLVDDLLDVSRIARGMLELKRLDLDLSTVVDDALEMTAPLVEQRRHRVVTDVAPVVVHGDPHRLAQAVANLIMNAAKYSDIGSQIRIHTRRSGELVKLMVADDGVGIASDMIATVFDAFVQQPQTLARSQGGLGLGLSIVKGLVEGHGGAVYARSDGPGKGSTFVIELPAIEGASARRIAPVRRALRAPSAARRILVVDDNHDAAAALRSGLEELGHVVVVAHDGPSALAEAATFRPQIGLLDIGLPGMDGYELAIALGAAYAIHLVAITGYGQPRDRQRSRDAGFEGHLVKPVELERLERLLQELTVDEPLG